MLVVVGFFVIALMRVIQKLCGKKSSYLIEPGLSFFRYTAVDQLFASLFALLSFVVYSASGLNWQTAVCSFIMAILFTLDNFTGIEAIKGASLVVVNMYANGGLIISCILSWILFGEAMSIPQMIGLVIFFISIYLLTPSGEKETKKISKRTFIMLIGSTLVNGAVMIVQKYFSLKVVTIGGNPAMFSFFTFFLSSVMMAFCWIFFVIRNRKKNIKEIKYTVTISDNNGEKLEKSRKTFLGMPLILYLYAGLLAFALFTINILITEMGKTVSAVVLFPISSSISILITVLVGWIVFKEKLSVKNIIGLVLGVLCIIVIGTFTPETISAIF